MKYQIVMKIPGGFPASGGYKIDFAAVPVVDGVAVVPGGFISTCTAFDADTEDEAKAAMNLYMGLVKETHNSIMRGLRNEPEADTPHFVSSK